MLEVPAQVEGFSSPLAGAGRQILVLQAQHLLVDGLTGVIVLGKAPGLGAVVFNLFSGESTGVLRAGVIEKVQDNRQGLIVAQVQA